MNTGMRFVRVSRRLVATALLGAVAATASAAGGTSATQAVIADPAGAWDRFLATAEYGEAYSAYETLIDLRYTLLEVDAAACTEHARALDDAVAKAPVSIAVHRARMLCAEAMGDDDAAEEALQAITALSRLALQDGRETFWPKPIRVLGPMDVYALLYSSGLQFRYEYFPHLKPRRYFTLNVAAWDDMLGVERHLAFDYIDVVNAISRGDTFSGYPFQRQLLAESFVASQVASGEEQAIDWQAISEAAIVESPAEKIAALQPGIEAGGLQSLATWLVVCGLHPQQHDCADGFVEALLPHAEKEHAAHTVLMSLAYAAGVGVEQDEEAAATLLDAANRRWYDDGALVLFGQTWGLLQREPPAFLRSRMDAAAAKGNVAVAAVTAWWSLMAPGVPKLDARQIGALSHASNNRLGMGYNLLVKYHAQRDEAFVANAWMKQASDAGDPDAQAGVGAAMFERAATPQVRDEALRLIALGAQGGNAYGMRFMAHQAILKQDWAAAEGWVLAAAGAGDIEALFQLADLYEWQRPGIQGKQQQAIDMYTALAADPEYPLARRRLAFMAMAGRGIEKDEVQAERWLLQDAEAGDGESAMELAGLYLMPASSVHDVAKGESWMQRAIELGHEEAYASYGAWFFYARDNSLDVRRRGIELWDKGADEGARWALNNAAWARCTAPEPELFDPVRGLADAGRIMADGDDVPMAMLDTVAACHAAAGDYAKAIELQERVVAALGPADAETDSQREHNFTSRLEEYRAGRRHVEPHLDPERQQEAETR